MTTLDDFLNMDMLTGGGAGEGRDSDDSPESAFLGLPPTPPQPDMDSMPSLADPSLNDMFSFYMADKPPAADQGYNFFASFSPPEPSSSSATSASPAMPDDVNFFAIDPQLTSVALPAQPAPAAAAKSASASKSSRRSSASMKTPRVSSSIADDEDDEDDEEEEDDEDDDGDSIIAPVKVGGRGKAGRKGTLASGGIKKFGGQAVKDADDPEDWRPTVDEYKKMSSKEKRQLRNKISARNFRIRRKEYITTLEGDVAERDKLIELIREELGATKLENEALRREVDALKKAMLEGRVAPNLPPPAPLDAVKAATDAATKRTTRSSKAARVNTQKDLPSSSPRTASARAFWGGSAGGAFNGITPVHTTLVPDFASLISNFTEKQQAQVAPIAPFGFFQEENINPALNSSCFTNRTVSGIAQPQTPGAPGGFDNFTDQNPFTLKNLESYRMQLWGKMAREMSPSAAFNAVNNAAPMQPAAVPPAFNVPGLKPLFLDSTNAARRGASPSLSEILSGKSSAKAGPSSSKPASPAPGPEHAMLAAVASQTLLGKMSSAFWDAFAGPATGSTPAGKKPDWDADKVRRVLEGTAVVRVVDVEAPKPKPADPAAALEESMRSLSLHKEASSAASPAGKPKDDGANALTGMFAGLRLGARPAPPARS